MITSHDIIVVGGGGAGLRAAIAAAETIPGLDVAVVSKVYPMRSHTVSAEGGAAGVVAEDDSLDEHAYDTISGGDWLCDQNAVELFVKEAPRELVRLEHWGCPWSRTPDGRIAVRPFGGMKKQRTWFAADKTGFHLLHTLFQTSLKYETVRRYDEWFVTKLLVDDGRVQGVVAVEISTGRIETLLARSVILATGGCGRVFPFTTNAAIKTGDGMALAYRAGAPLKDMEFIQYHPTGLPFTGILITEAARAEGGWLLNKDGYRYLQDYDLGTPSPTPVMRSMELGPRDRLSQAFEHEVEKGRTIETPYGPVVHLDLRHLGAAKIDAKIPFVRELCLNYQNIDPARELVPVRPVVHYAMGGVHTDIDGATPIPGLFAAGEVACVSINGANRLGSNSLPELFVFGTRAGRAAAWYTLRAKEPYPGSRCAGGGRAAPAGGRRAGPGGWRRSDIGHPDRHAIHDGGKRWHLSDWRFPRQGRGRPARAPGAASPGDTRRPKPGVQHRAGCRDRASRHARRVRGHRPERDPTGGVAGSSPAHRLPQARRRTVPRSFRRVPGARRVVPHRVSASDDHPVAARRAGLRKVMMADTITLDVARYRPGQEAEPTLQSYDVPLRDDWVVLDGLNYVKDELDGTLSYRWSCRMGICGSCGMTVNGEPKLTCATFLTEYAPGPIRVEPLGNFPVLRDLVVDIDDFLDKLSRVKPWIVRDEAPVSEGEYLQTPEELEEFRQYSMCINCMLCYSACPVYGIDEEFVGPAAIALAQRYNLDSRDEGAADRLDVLIHPDGIWGCTFVGDCTRVCPKHVDPAGAIQRYKLTAAMDTLKSYLLPRGRR